MLEFLNIQIHPNEHLSELLSSIKQPQKRTITRLIRYVYGKKALCLEGSGFKLNLMTKYPMAINSQHLLFLVCYFHDTTNINYLICMKMLAEKFTETIFNNLVNEPDITNTMGIIFPSNTWQTCNIIILTLEPFLTTITNINFARSEKNTKENTLITVSFY